jgi:hypothetical protein
MLFDRVAQKLPRGWAWRDEWAVDMTGADDEGCDAEGWSYGEQLRCRSAAAAADRC